MPTTASSHATSGSSLLGRWRAWRSARATAALNEYGVYRDARVVRKLIARGANPNVKNEDGLTVLSKAIRSNPKVVDALLAGGAQVPALTNSNPTDVDFWDGVFLTLAFGREQAIPVSRSLFAHAPEGSRRMIVAAAFRQVAGREHTRTLVEELNFLLSVGADAHAIDDRLQTFLHRAARDHNVSVVEVLLKHGADPTLLDEIGMTPLHLCVMGNGGAGAHEEIVSVIRLLADYGADVNARNDEGSTALDEIESELRRAGRPSVRVNLERIRECLLAFSQEKAGRQSASLDAELPPAKSSARGRL